MASITKIEGKRGTTYKIVVTLGRDMYGKQIRHFLTWRPDASMSAREEKRELQRVATEFEQDLLYGYQPDNKMTFAEYAEYCYKLREQRGDKPQTLARVRRQTARINEYIGHMKLQDIKPRTLNELYKKLAAPGSCTWHTFAAPLVDFKALADGYTYKEFGAKCGVSAAIMRRVCLGNLVKPETAKTIETHLKRSGLFEIINQDMALSPSTIRDYHAVISTVLKQAYRDMIIKDNPADRAILPKMKRVRESRALQPEELSAVLAALEKEPVQFRAMVTFFIVTGCRRGEVLALSWDKIDYKRKEVTIDRSMIYLPETGIQSGPTKTDNSRRVALPQEAIDLLRQHWKAQATERLKLGDLWHNSNLVFTRWNGLPINPGALNFMLDKFSKRHNLPHINPHLFRHTAASLLLSNGVDVLTVANMLGHADISTTLDIYAHEIEQARRKTADCISEIILQNKQA